MGIFAYTGASHALSLAFSNRNIRGTYAGVLSGVVLKNGTPLNVVGSGIFVADGRGNISGTSPTSSMATPAPRPCPALTP